MKFYLIDGIVGGSAITLVMVLAGLISWGTYTYGGIPTSFAGIVSILIFSVAVVGLTCFIGRILQYISPLKQGHFKIAFPTKEATIWKLQSFLNLFNLSVLIHTYFVPVTLRGVIYNILGSKIGKNAMIGGKIIEPFMIEIGNFVILGEDCLVLGHTIVSDRVMLGRIRIGNQVTIGVKAIIMPDVEIGDGTVVGAGALVMPHVKIGVGAMVCAGAIVPKNTYIPDGARWGSKVTETFITN